LRSASSPLRYPFTRIADAAEAPTLHSDTLVQMSAYTPSGVALQPRLCSERVECTACLRDLSLAEKWTEQLNDGLDLSVSFCDPLERIDAAVALDPAYPTE
jgi:hypothetical protein